MRLWPWENWHSKHPAFLAFFLAASRRCNASTANCNIKIQFEFMLVPGLTQCSIRDQAPPLPITHNAPMVGICPDLVKRPFQGSNMGGFSKISRNIQNLGIAMMISTNDHSPDSKEVTKNEVICVPVITLWRL